MKMIENKIKKWLKEKSFNELESDKIRLDDSLSWIALYKGIYNELPFEINEEVIKRDLKYIS